MSDNEKNDSIDKSIDDAVHGDKNTDNTDTKKMKTKESLTVFYKLQLNELQELLEKEKKNTFTAIEKWKRALADYQNLEKRKEQEIIDKVNTKTDKLIIDFLDVYENFVRAKDVYVNKEISVEGLDIIIKNMESILSEYEVKPIDAIGNIFDPNLHEAVSTVNDQSLDDNTITKEIAKGYISQNRVIKASKVIVSKKSQVNE
jgi:molecular chaperone GrpE